MDKQPGNKQQPDFKELDDRLIAEASNDPKIVIKTNLDPKNATEENPYYQGDILNKEKFTSYFDEGSE